MPLQSGYGGTGAERGQGGQRPWQTGGSFANCKSCSDGWQYHTGIAKEGTFRCRCGAYWASADTRYAKKLAAPEGGGSRSKSYEGGKGGRGARHRAKSRDGKASRGGKGRDASARGEHAKGGDEDETQSGEADSAGRCADILRRFAAENGVVITGAENLSFEDEPEPKAKIVTPKSFAQRLPLARHEWKLAAEDHLRSGNKLHAIEREEKKVRERLLELADQHAQAQKDLLEQALLVNAKMDALAICQKGAVADSSREDGASSNSNASSDWFMQGRRHRDREREPARGQNEAEQKAWDTFQRLLSDRTKAYGDQKELYGQMAGGFDMADPDMQRELSEQLERALHDIATEAAAAPAGAPATVSFADVGPNRVVNEFPLTPPFVHWDESPEAKAARDAAMLAEANLVGVDDSVMGGILRSTGCKRGAENDISSDDEEDEDSVRKARQRTERQLQQFPGEGGVGNQQV